MRKKRFKSIFAMILAASMVMGSGVSAAGAELSTVAGAGDAVEETVSDSGTEERTDAGEGNPVESVTDMASGNAGDTGDEDNNGGNKEALDNTDKNAPEQTLDGSEESVSKDAATEDEVKTPAEEGISDNSASDDQVSDNGISDNGISVNDAGLTEGSESEDAAGAAESLILYVSGNTVSYDGTYKAITVSSNLTGADYSFDYSIISANDTDEAHKYPSAYKDFSKGTSANITVNKSATTIPVNAVDAGRYAVSVNALSKNGTSLSIISNNVVFLSINKAGPVSISINGATKYYDGTPLMVSSKPYQTGGTLYPRDQNLAAVSDNLTDAGSKYVSTNTVKKYLEKNYSKVTVSSGKLTVLSTNLVITTKDFFKNYDGKKVEPKEREGVIYSSPDAVDIKTLSANLGLSANDFIWDKTSLISGDEVSSSENKVSLNSATYEKLMKSGNFASIKIKYGTITIQKNTWTSNSLTAPVITTVKQNNKGWITINWKGSKVYKNKEEKDSKKNQARYKIYRYDAEHENWILLNGNNTANEKNKEIDKEYGQTGRSFVDKQAGRYDDSTYIYKVQVVGHDESGVYGMSQPAYKLCQPMPLEVATRQKDAKSIDFEFSKINGAGMYVVEKSSTNKKDSYVTLVSMSASLIRDRKYSGAKLVSAKSYNDKGQLVEKNIKQPADSVYVTDSPVAENTFLFYRVYATASVTDYKENGMPVAGKISVKSDTSASLKGRNTICPPDILSVGSAKYNQTSVVFEMLSTDQIRVGLDKDCAKDKYQILRSTKVDGGYSVVKTITGKQLVGDIEGLKEVKKGTYISINGINLTAQKDCYLYTFNNLKPEIRYYYKMRAVRNNVVGAAGNYMSVMPVMDDVTSINAINKNYNQITVSTNYIEGAKQMVITYRAIKDYQGNTINEGSNKDSTWRSKVFPIKMDSKTKKPITEFVVGGLKHGYTYEFYAEPKNGRKHETPVSKRKTDQEYTRVGMAKVKASPKSLTEIYVQWESVPGATSYTLEIWDAEDTKATAPIKTQEFKKAGKHTWRGGDSGEIDPKPNQPNYDNAGKPYTFYVVATRKDSYFKTGKQGDRSLGVTEAGRPRAVTNLKAAINAVNADAKLTWTASKDNSSKTKITYMIERDVYRYDTKTVNTFAKTSVSSTIIDYKKATNKTSYASNVSVTGSAFYNGDKVIYKVTPIYQSGVAGRGKNKDGYIYGVTSKVTYITPYSITINGRTELTVGSSATLSVSYRPTSVTAKGVNWSANGNGTYFSMNGATVTGLNSSGNWNDNIYVQAVSKATGVASNKGLIKVNAKPVSSSLKVCIDAGHGGEDSGATYNGLLEKNCNLDMANAMKSRLEAYGVQVVMTRTSDTYLTVGSRPEVAYNNGCNLFISIHCNSGGASGTEVYKSITQYHDDDLAGRILSKVTAAAGTPSRGVKTRIGNSGDYYGVIRGSANRGINGMIVETAFMDGDYSKLNNASTRQQIGTAIADAVLERYGYK